MTDDDRDTVRAIRRGDREAFGDLVRRYQGRLFGLVLMMVRHPAGAEEVAQDAWLRAPLTLAAGPREAEPRRSEAQPR